MQDSIGPYSQPGEIPDRQPAANHSAGFGPWRFQGGWAIGCPAQWALAGLLLLITLASYIPVTWAQFVWDDESYVTENRLLRSASGLRQIWLAPRSSPQYYPLVFSTYWVEYHLWGLRPLGYHLVNVLLHAANAILAWRVLRRLGVPGAYLAAVLFAVHPVQVESVAWVTERKNVLSALFYLSALLAYLRFQPLETCEATTRGSRYSYALATFLFVCALLSKTVTCSLPAVILLLVWWRRGRIALRDALAMAPWFVLGVALAMVTVWMEAHHVGASGEAWTFSLVERVLIAGRALWVYLGKLLLPYRLTFIYPRWQIDAWAWWQYVFPVSAVALVIVLWLARKRIGRAPLTAALIFGGSLLPALGLVNVYPMRFSFVADHFCYLAGLSVLAFLAAVVVITLDRYRVAAQRAGVVVCTGAVLFLGVLSWRQALIYRDVETLWHDTLGKNPGAWMAHNNFGVFLIGKGRTAEAIWHCTQALRIKSNCAEAHYNLGLALAAEGKTAEAVARYKQALQIKPEFADAQNDLGLALAAQGKTAEAITHHSEALRIDPDHASAHNNLGLALAKQGKIARAVAHYTKALRIDPNFAEAHNNLALALTAQRKTAEAVTHYTEALRLEPDRGEIYYNLGRALAAQGKTGEAIANYAQALRIKPDFAEAHNDWGLASAMRGNTTEAVAHYNQALRIDPNCAMAHFNLGNVMARQGNTAEAVAHYMQALRSRPDFAEAHSNLGSALTMQGKTAEAIAHYQEALRIKPDFADAHCNLGVALAAQGKTAEAVAHLTEALRINPNLDAARRGLKSIRQRRR